MSKVSMTVRQIMDLGLWDRVCDYKGWSPWIYNEGQIRADELVEFDSTFEKEEEPEENQIDEYTDEQLDRILINKEDKHIKIVLSNGDRILVNYNSIEHIE